MQLGMVGLGRMGADMVRRLVKGGHECVAFDRQGAAVTAVLQPGVVAAASLDDLVAALAKPRTVWLMLPAAAVDDALALLLPRLAAGDVIIDGGNSYYRDDIRRAAALKAQQIDYVDVGTSGGVAGLERGYCLMVGGEKEVVIRLAPLFATLAPGVGAGAAAGQSPSGSAPEGYLHCGTQGAGHFVKMIHNGIEYGIMAAYAEGLTILRRANCGKQEGAIDAETTPLREPQYYQYEFDLAQIAEVWRHGSVIGSWLLDLTASALQNDATLAQYAGRVSDSGEGRWTIMAAIDEAVPVPVLSGALFERFSSRGNGDFTDKVMSAMRYGFGGHVEKKPRPDGD